MFRKCICWLQCSKIDPDLEMFLRCSHSFLVPLPPVTGGGGGIDPGSSTGPGTGSIDPGRGAGSSSGVVPGSSVGPGGATGNVQDQDHTPNRAQGQFQVRNFQQWLSKRRLFSNGRKRDTHWGQGYPETSGNILGTSQGLGQFYYIVTSRHIYDTFGMCC